MKNSLTQHSYTSPVAVCADALQAEAQHNAALTLALSKMPTEPWFHDSSHTQVILYFTCILRLMCGHVSRISFVPASRHLLWSQAWAQGSKVCACSQSHVRSSIHISLHAALAGAALVRNDNLLTEPGSRCLLGTVCYSMAAASWLSCL